MSHGPLMLDIAGTELTAEEREILLHPIAGGVILFSRNYQVPDQLQALVQELHRLKEPALLVAVDQEGGRVQRFREGFTQLPPAAWFGQRYDENPARALQMTRNVGWLMAAELRGCGIDFSFAPVVDLGCGISKVIGDRAFHAQPRAVADLAQAWMRGAHEAGMAAVAKHFPGHGNVAEDSHLALPRDRRRPQEIMMDDLLPFQFLIDQGLEAIMPAHVIYEGAAPELAGFSRFWLKRVLREQLGFQGVVFSDDLTMAAAGEAGGFADRARAALDAGCDVVLVCNDPEGAVQVLEALDGFTDPAGQMRMIRMHGRSHPGQQPIHLDPRWKQAVEIVSLYESGQQALDLDL